MRDHDEIDFRTGNTKEDHVPHGSPATLIPKPLLVSKTDEPNYVVEDLFDHEGHQLGIRCRAKKPGEGIRLQF